MGEKVFVIEHCENCAQHQWNTRHDAAQYKAKAQECKYILQIKVLWNIFIVAGEITSAVSGAQVIFNLVPKAFHGADIYCQLIPNNDDA